jgi:hypothetical protein
MCWKSAVYSGSSCVLLGFALQAAAAVLCCAAHLVPSACPLHMRLSSKLSKYNLLLLAVLLQVHTPAGCCWRGCDSYCAGWWIGSSQEPSSG